MKNAVTPTPNLKAIRIVSRVVLFTPALVVMPSLIGTLPDARAQALVARPIPVMCGPYDAITAGLGSRYAERRVAWGRMESSVVELWRSPKGTFTIIVRLANGIACLPAVGDDWTDDRGT